MLLRNRVPSGRLLSEQVISIDLMAGVSWLTVRSREHIECGIGARRRLIGMSIGWLAVVLSLSVEMLSERLRSGHS